VACMLRLSQITRLLKHIPSSGRRLHTFLSAVDLRNCTELTTRCLCIATGMPDVEPDLISAKHAAHSKEPLHSVGSKQATKWWLIGAITTLVTTMLLLLLLQQVGCYWLQDLELRCCSSLRSPSGNNGCSVIKDQVLRLQGRAREGALLYLPLQHTTGKQQWCAVLRAVVTAV
jgi:hypothetical protein